MPTYTTTQAFTENGVQFTPGEETAVKFIVDHPYVTKILDTPEVVTTYVYSASNETIHLERTPFNKVIVSLQCTGDGSFAFCDSAPVDIKSGQTFNHTDIWGHVADITVTGSFLIVVEEA
jgi:hypothetical protein